MVNQAAVATTHGRTPRLSPEPLARPVPETDLHHRHAVSRTRHRRGAPDVFAGFADLPKSAKGVSRVAGGEEHFQLRMLAPRFPALIGPASPACS